MEWQWHTDAFDAVHISLPNMEIEIAGTDAEQVFLEGGDDNHYMRSEPTIQGRWLIIHPTPGSGEWTLELPKNKAWTIELSAASGEVEIHNVHARLQVQLGSGEIHVENCRGAFNLQSGSGDVEIEDCLQADVPTVPEFSFEEPARASGGIPPIPPIPPAGKRIHLGKHITIDDDKEWQQYGQQWEEWGEQFAEQASRWADKFARELGGSFGWKKMSHEPGMHVQLGSGDVQIEQVDAQHVTVQLGSGDVNLEEGRIAELAVDTSRGDVQIENILPAANWDLATRHGDIQLVLPDDTNARLDAATRHGDIDSEVPLVGVGRPGRAARHGGRMVGTLGQVGENPIEIHLESLHGDIHITTTGHNSRYAGQPAQSRAARAPAPPVVPTPPTPPTPPAPSTSDMPSNTFAAESDNLQASGASQSQTRAGNAAQVYDSQLAILQAVQKGEISVKEAEMLLQSIKE